MERRTRKYCWFGTDFCLLAPEISSNYTLDISSSKCGEKVSFASAVKTFPLSTFSITPSNQINCANTFAEISVKDAKKVQWEPQESLVAKGSAAIITPKTTTTYQANIEDQYGCLYEVNYTQYVLFDPSSVHFFIPNAFTPNGDGKNDIFRVRTDVAFDKYSLRIFNRYGQLVFETRNPEMGWDGSVEKVPQPTGTYIYEVVAHCGFCGEFYKKGTIVLIR